MIIGTGLIAKAFGQHDKEEVIFFASGVSNSLETDQRQFDREKCLILNTINSHPTKLFIYFSTCSIYDPSKYESAYVLHKLHMEQLIKNECNSFLILRISNAVGNGGNPNLLMNYLAKTIKLKESVTIYKKAKRNLIDVKDIQSITMQLLKFDKYYNKIINIAFNQNFSIEEIVSSFENHWEMSTPKIYLDQGESYSIDISVINEYFQNISKDDYLKRLIQNYY